VAWTLKWSAVKGSYNGILLRETELGKAVCYLAWGLTYPDAPLFAPPWKWEEIKLWVKFEDGLVDFNVLQTEGDDSGVDETKKFGSSIPGLAVTHPRKLQFDAEVVVVPEVWNCKPSVIYPCEPSSSGGEDVQFKWPEMTDQIQAFGELSFVRRFILLTYGKRGSKKDFKHFVEEILVLSFCFLCILWELVFSHNCWCFHF
jgi:hypothetical protein